MKYLIFIIGATVTAIPCNASSQERIAVELTVQKIQERAGNLEYYTSGTLYTSDGKRQYLKHKKSIDRTEVNSKGGNYTTSYNFDNRKLVVRNKKTKDVLETLQCSEPLKTNSFTMAGEQKTITNHMCGDLEKLLRPE